MGLLHTLKHLPAFLRILRKGEFTGDAVILKSSFGKFEPTDQYRDFIRSRSRIVPDFCDIDFSKFAPGSLGYAYHQFMKHQGLTPFRFSGRYLDLMEKNYLPIYYASVHDFFHALIGYDASLAGEAGVWAFVAAQNVSPQAHRAYRLTQLLFPFAKLRKWELIRLAGSEGFQLGLKAAPILKMDFRAELGNPLTEVRARYGVTPTSLEEISFPRPVQ